jgi:hypothetical protein
MDLDGDSIPETEVVVMDSFTVFGSDPDTFDWDGYLNWAQGHDFDMDELPDPFEDFDSLEDFFNWTLSIDTSIGGSLIITGSNFYMNIATTAVNGQTGRGQNMSQLSVSSSNANGLIIQKVERSFDVRDANGNPLTSSDPGITGTTSLTYYEAWEVKNGVVGITANGTFYPSNIDRITFPAWPGSVQTGAQSIITTAIFVSGATITSEYTQDTSQYPTAPSANLPYSYTPPAAWDANAAGSIVRETAINFSSTSNSWSISESYVLTTSQTPPSN